MAVAHGKYISPLDAEEDFDSVLLRAVTAANMFSATVFAVDKSPLPQRLKPAHASKYMH